MARENGTEHRRVDDPIEFRLALGRDLDLVDEESGRMAGDWVERRGWTGGGEAEVGPQHDRTARRAVLLTDQAPDEVSSDKERDVTRTSVEIVS